MSRLRSGKAAQAVAQKSSTPLRRSPRKKTKRGPNQPNTPSRPKRLHSAIKSVAEGMSIRTASYVYNVRRSTLSDRIHKKSTKMSVGRPTQLSSTEEQAITDHLLLQADWGFPLTREEVQLVVKDYLDKKGAITTRFKDNLPGQRWVRLFLKRHPELNCRIPKFISCARAKVNPTLVEKYFDNLGKTLKDVPPERIANFDETNVADNPACKEVLVRRGEKYPVKVLTTSKSAVSVMFCGTAAGLLFPPYVVYRSKELCETWTVGGPTGTRYNRSKSGWFDKVIFEDWFISIIVPWARRMDGKKVVIGDNVSSHFSLKVFELCAEHDILFVCLPPNSTHLLQPLDVAFFGPLKTAWKQILNKWKQDGRNRTLTLPKPHFPGLLKQLVEAIEGRRERNLQTAFRATGIYPLDKIQALKRIPGGVQSPSRQEVYQRVSTSFVEQLQEKRYGQQGPARRGRRLAVSPGKSWVDPERSTTIDPTEEEADDDLESDPGSDHSEETATPRRSTRLSRQPQLSPQQTPVRRTRNPGACRGRQRNTQQSSNPTRQSSPPIHERDVISNIEPKPGDWVLVKVASKRKVTYSVALVDHVENLELACKFIHHREKGLFFWPKPEVVKLVDYSDVEEVLPVPKKVKVKGAPFKFSRSFNDLQLN